MNDWDSPWKEICDAFFPDMTALLLPEVYADVDWTQPVRMRDKELPKLKKKHRAGKNYADKLIEVHLKNGEQQVVFLHIEFQHQHDPKFPVRMYRYNYRIFDKFDEHVISIAILGDTSPTWIPNLFSFKRWGFDLSMAYSVIKLIHYRSQRDMLVASKNPFAIVLLAYLAAVETENRNPLRYARKLALTKRLYQKNFTQDTIVNLFHFIDWVMELPKDLSERFGDELAIFEGETNMPYISSIERLALKKGHKKGREEGLQEGREEGLQEGRMHMIEALTSLLTQRFGPLPAQFTNLIKTADTQRIGHWLDRVLTMNTLEDLLESP